MLDLRFQLSSVGSEEEEVDLMLITKFRDDNIYIFSAVMRCACALRAGETRCANSKE
jgi:hypothetical protein